MKPFQPLPMVSMLALSFARQALSALVPRHCECQQPNLEKFVLGESDYLQRDDATTEKCCSSEALSRAGTIEPHGENKGRCTVIKDTSVGPNDAFSFLACCFLEPIEEFNLLQMSFAAACSGG